MLHLRVFGAAEALQEMGPELDRRGAARSVTIVPAVRPDHMLLTAEVHPEQADAVLRYVAGCGVAHEDVALARFDDVGTIHLGRAGSLIWADVVGRAAVNARPVARYLAFMAAAGVIAAFGVIEVNQILIVGAMAISPDLLPVTAACTALVARRAALAIRALVTLTIGLSVACLSGAALTALLELADLLPDDFVVGESALAGLTSVNVSTIGVALAAGIAGMLAVETRASAAVGVGISITTIPAAAYLGVAVGAGEADRVLGALAVLGANVAMLLVGGTSTLLLQRRLARMSAQAATWADAGADGTARAGGAESRPR
jgi:uncharacterized hydrophobic protein (TIGR00271 family)